MPRKTNLERTDSRRRPLGEMRTSRPRPKVDFPLESLDFKNVNLLKQFVTDAGRILPRKYTGLPARYQRRMARAVKRARQMLLMK